MPNTRQARRLRPEQAHHVGDPCRDRPCSTPALSGGHGMSTHDSGEPGMPPSLTAGPTPAAALRPPRQHSGMFWARRWSGAAFSIAACLAPTHRAVSAGLRQLLHAPRSGNTRFPTPSAAPRHAEGLGAAAGRGGGRRAAPIHRPALQRCPVWGPLHRPALQRCPRRLERLGDRGFGRPQAHLRLDFRHLL